MKFNNQNGSITSLLTIDTTVAVPNNNATNVLVINGNGGLVIPTGSTAQQPTNQIGTIRYNTDIQSIEINNGSYWMSGSNPELKLITSATTADQVVDSVLASAYRTIKYLVQVTSGTVYQSSEIIIVHDGTTSSIGEYGQIFTGATLATFDSSISGGNVRLLVTPTNAVTTIKVIRQTITI